jgi:hypothetical protein
MLRVASAAVASNACAASGIPSVASSSSSFFNVDTRKKQVTLFDPATCGGASTAPEDRRVGVAAPKMFAFDAIFTADDSQVRNMSNPPNNIILSLREIIKQIFFKCINLRCCCEGFLPFRCAIRNLQMKEHKLWHSSKAVTICRCVIKMECTARVMSP